MLSACSLGSDQAIYNSDLIAATTGLVFGALVFAVLWAVANANISDPHPPKIKKKG